MTRLEIVEHVASGFGESPLTREQLVTRAERAGARPAVVHILEQLPDGNFYNVRQLWPALPDLPIDSDTVGP